MKIEINPSDFQDIPATEIADGTLVYKKHLGENCIFLKFWGGLASMDGKLFIDASQMVSTYVRPLQTGTVVKITI